MHKHTIRRMYEEYAFFIHRRCKRMLGSEAEADDALQEVFLQLIRHVEKLEERETLLPWLNRVTTNHCLTQIRRRSSRRPAGTEVDEIPDTTTVLFDTLLARQDLVSWLVGAAPEEEREVVIRYFLHEESVAAIADATRVSVPTVRRRIRAFVTTARGRLAREDEPE
jgi:RNA polymerase sigma-70 factor (ECF subfamily)